MGNYVKITDFAVKDSLLTGNPLKLITGTAHDNEYNAIAVAVATKIDSGGALNTPSSGTLTNCTGLPVATGVSGLGTGIATALAVNVGSAGSPVVNGGALGTPSSGTLTSCTGLPQAGTVGLTTADAPEFAGVNVGHASDTTITRVSAGTVAVEGVNLLTTATGAALSGSSSQVFSVAAATAAAHAVRLDQAGKRVAQIVTTQTGLVATGTTILPVDNTIPQNTEGDQYMTLSITPTNINSTLEIEISFVGAINAATSLSVALFQDAVANALSVATAYCAVSGGINTVRLFHSMSAATTSAIAFKVRAGPQGAGTVTFNGSGGAQLFGGVAGSTITIKEYLP